MNSFILIAALHLCWVNPTENVDGSPLEDLNLVRLYAGAETGNYDQVAVVMATNPGEEQCHDWNLDPGTYHIAATASDVDGNESAYSNEVVKIVPGIALAAPTQEGAASQQVNMIIGETGKPVIQEIDIGDNQYFMVHLVEWGNTLPDLKGGEDGSWSTSPDGNPVWTFTPKTAGLFYIRVRSCDSNYTNCSEWSNGYDQGHMFFFKLQAPDGGIIE